MPRIEIRDTRLHYEIRGDGEVPLLFIHGMCGGAWVWDDQVSRLSDRFLCVAYDRRGHSRSAPGTRDQSDAVHAEDALALMDALRLDRPVLIGSSGGGAVAIDLLHRRPHAARAAVLSEPALFGIHPDGGRDLLDEIAAAIEGEAGGARAVEAFFDVVAPGVWQRLGTDRNRRYLENAPLLLATLESPHTAVTAEDLAAIDLPVLAVSGGDSRPVFRTVVRRLVECLPHVTYLELEGAGHATYVDRPEAFADAVAEVASEVAAGA